MAETHAVKQAVADVLAGRLSAVRGADHSHVSRSSIQRALARRNAPPRVLSVSDEVRSSVADVIASRLTVREAADYYHVSMSAIYRQLPPGGQQETAPVPKNQT